VNWAIANWSVSGVQHYLNGQPISIFGATGVPGKNSYIRFNRVAGQPVKNSAYKNPLAFNATSNATACATGYFNCSAFYDPNLYQNRDPSGAGSSGEGNPWRFGTMPRNSSDIRGPGYLTEDFGISKGIPITEKIKADFRAEMFDAFNRHIFTKRAQKRAVPFKDYLLTPTVFAWRALQIACTKRRANRQGAAPGKQRAPRF
jgi:hypothetical protein